MPGLLSIRPLTLPQVGSVSFEREAVANHAKNLASNIRGNLRRSLESIGVVRGLTSSPQTPSLVFARVQPARLRTRRSPPHLADGASAQDILNGNGKLVGPHKARARSAFVSSGSHPRAAGLVRPARPRRRWRHDHG